MFRKGKKDVFEQTNPHGRYYFQTILIGPTAGEAPVQKALDNGAAKGWTLVSAAGSSPTSITNTVMLFWDTQPEK